jgi:hypothetical protein
MTSSKALVASEPRFKSIAVTVPRALIVVFKSIVESHDNLATLRTEDRRRNILKIYFAAELEEDVEAMLAGLAKEMEVKKVET